MSGCFLHLNKDMAEEALNPLQYIPEIVLKKRKSNEEWAIRRKKQLEERVKRIKGDTFRFKKPEEFVKEYRDSERDFVLMKHRVKGRKNKSLVPESKLLFVIRIGGKRDMHPKTRKILYHLKLRRIFKGVFVKANEGIMTMLQKVEPFVTYGYPTYQTVRDLIYKKGSAKINDQIIPLTDNGVIEVTLGQYGVTCIEDIVNQIATVDSHFNEVNSLLCPFTLEKPAKPFQSKKIMYKRGGDTGNREDDINELINMMN